MGGVAPSVNYQAAQQQVVFGLVLDAAGTGIGAGDFAALSYEVASGYTVSAADFTVVDGSVTVKDANGNDIKGVTLTLK
jgi:hypothetical protein